MSTTMRLPSGAGIVASRGAEADQPSLRPGARRVCPDQCPMHMANLSAALKRTARRYRGSNQARLRDHRSRARFSASAAPLAGSLRPALHRPHWNRTGHRGGRAGRGPFHWRQERSRQTATTITGSPISQWPEHAVDRCLRRVDSADCGLMISYCLANHTGTFCWRAGVPFTCRYRFVNTGEPVKVDVTVAALIRSSHTPARPGTSVTEVTGFRF